MRFPGKLVFGVLLAAAVLMAAAGSASARRFFVNERQFQILWPVPLHSGGGGGIRAECPITLGGSFHSATIAKVSGQLIGYINRATVNQAGCISGSMTILQEVLPWHVRYQSFTGVLPRILGVTIQVVNAGFSVTETFGFNTCLFRSTAAQPIRLILELTETGAVARARADETSTIPMSGSEPCFAEPANWTGAERMTTPNGSTTITVRLVQ
jgi:hypothetical protein